MEHLVPDEEIDDHVSEDTCPCKPRIIYDSRSGELIAIHTDEDGEQLSDEEALQMIRDDDEVADNFRKRMGLE